MPPSVRQCCPAAVVAAAEEPPSVSKRMSSSQLRSSPKASARETKKLPATPETAPFPPPAMRLRTPEKSLLATLAAVKRKKAIKVPAPEMPEILPPQTAPEIRIRLLHLLPFLPLTEPAQREPLLSLWQGRFFVFQALRVCGAVLQTPASSFQARGL